MLHVIGPEVQAIHWFLANAGVFTNEEVIAAFGMDKFPAEEWPKSNEEWNEVLHRKLSSIEVGTICARLTTVLADNKHLITAETQYISRNSNIAAEIPFANYVNEFFGDADLVISASSPLFVDGERYHAWHAGYSIDVMPIGNKITFPLWANTLGMGIVIYQEDNLILSGITSGTYPVEVTVEGTVEYFGAKKTCSENVTVLQAIRPGFTVTRIGGHEFHYTVDQNIIIYGATFILRNNEIAPSKLKTSVNINGRTYDDIVFVSDVNQFGDTWYIPQEYTELFIERGEGNMALSFQGGEEAININYIKFYTYPPVDYALE